MDWSQPHLKSRSRWLRGARQVVGRRAPRIRPQPRAKRRLPLSGLTPLDFMLSVMRDEQADTATRLDAARAAAPYVHPRLAAIERRRAVGGEPGPAPWPHGSPSYQRHLVEAGLHPSLKPVRVRLPFVCQRGRARPLRPTGLRRAHSNTRQILRRDFYARVLCRLGVTGGCEDSVTATDGLPSVTDEKKPAWAGLG